MKVPVRAGAAIAAALLSGASFGVAPVATLDAAVPAPSDTTAVVHLAVGADRASEHTLAPLAGVTFGLFADRPTTTGAHGVATQPAAYSCVSDADGDCSISVPLGASTTPPGTRLWIAPTALPAGWSALPDPSADFRTGPLYPDRTETLPAVWPLTRAAAGLAPGCGHAVGVVTGAKPRSAVADLVAILQGTPSRLAWYGAGGTAGPLPVASAADAAALTGQVTSGGTRSWRKSLAALAAADAPAGIAGHLDLVVVVGPADPSTDPTALPAANRLAALGTRLVAATDVAPLRGALRAGCGPSVTVVSTTPVTATPTGGTPTPTDPVTGAITLPATATTTLSIAPTGATCTDLATDSVVAAAISGPNLTLPAMPATPVSCDVSVPADGSAPLTISHRWAVTTARGTTTYAEGQQPADLQAALSVAGHDQPWGTRRTGLPAAQPVPVGDTATSALPGCTLDGATASTAGAADQPLGATLTPGAWTITDHVTCHSSLTLQAAVVGGTAQPGDWTLSATGATSGPSGASGSPAVTGEVPGGAVYQLGQSGGSADYVPVRTDCRITSGGRPAIGYDHTGPSLTVPLGEDVTCTTTEATAELDLTTSVVDASADPTGWPLTATPTTPTTATATPTGTPGGPAAVSVTGGGEVALRPAAPYAVHQGAGPGGYQLTGLTCTIDGAAADAASLTIPPGSVASCTATDAASRWTVTQSSDPTSGWRVAPGAIITFTVVARHLTGRPTTDVAIDDDLASVLAHGQVEGTVATTAGTATLRGHRLSWAIPELTDTAQATFRVRVADHTDGTRLVGSITRATTTEPGGSGDVAVPCTQTALSHTVQNDTDRSEAMRCDAVVHPTLEAGDQDMRRLGWLIGTALVVSVVGTATAAVVSRRRTLRV